MEDDQPMSNLSGVEASRASARPSPSQVRWLRRTSVSAVLLLLTEYVIGIGVNLYVTVPSADHGHGIGTAIERGPAAISIHVVVGLLLLVAAVGLLVQAFRARLPTVIAASAIGLVAIGGAVWAGGSFVNGGSSAASMTMAVMTGVAVLSYVASVYLLGGLRRPIVLTGFMLVDPDGNKLVFFTRK
jgi:hypothetical protein